MVVYTFKIPKLFFLHLLLAFAELFEGLVATLTLGCVRFSISYSLIFRITILEMKERQKAFEEGRIVRKSENNLDKSVPWPRWQIWPPPAKPKKKARAERDAKLASHGIDVKKLDENLRSKS